MSDLNQYTIEELEEYFHTYFKAKQQFLRVARSFCEQQKVDEGQNGVLLSETGRQGDE